MPNIQFIESALNGTFRIYAATDEEFAALFPNGIDLTFYGDVRAELGPEEAEQILQALRCRPVDRRHVQGIHGTLLIGLESRRPFYPTRKLAETLSGTDAAAVLHLVGRDPG